VRILPEQRFREWARAARRRIPEAGSRLDEVQLYAPYLEGHPRFDDRNTRAMLNGDPLPSRAVPGYFERIAGYIRDRETPS
jgi:hypothetical protein